MFPTVTDYVRLQLRSLESRSTFMLYFALYMCYRIIFGLVNVCVWSDFFELNCASAASQTRGHIYKLYKRRITVLVTVVFECSTSPITIRVKTCGIWSPSFRWSRGFLIVCFFQNAQSSLERIDFYTVFIVKCKVLRIATCRALLILMHAQKCANDVTVKQF